MKTVPKKQVARLEISDLPAFERPAFTDQLRFPDNITELETKNLSDLMGKYAKLLAHVEQEATSWSVSLLRLEYLIEEAEARFLTENRKVINLERWRVDLLVRSEPEINHLYKKSMLTKQLKERSLSLVRTYERLINVLSRELSRRISSSGERTGRSFYS